MGQKQDTYVTMTIDAKKLAREEFTACSDPAKEESMVSMSLCYVSMGNPPPSDFGAHLSEPVEHTACGTD